MKFSTRIKKLIMGFLASATRRDLSRLGGRLSRKGPPTIHYFHQVDDPYSHMAVQKLAAFAARYQCIVVPYLVSAPTAAYQGDSERFSQWALRDARTVATYYGVDLPERTDQIDAGQLKIAEADLAKLRDPNSFATRATQIGNSLWNNQVIEGPTADNCTAEGNSLREKLGHYLSATFYFEGEWYWGLDRLHHLERRLCEMGLSNDPNSICVPRPQAVSTTGANASSITLEFYPSLRSPYTAISFDRVIDLVNRSTVKLDLKPVMPMMMRGVPAPRTKQLYILSDTRREAEYYSIPFGPIVDPFGEPVKRAFSLCPYMVEQGLGAAYCSNYLKASWAERIDITTDDGLRTVVDRTGASWSEASATFNNDEWQPLLENNVSDMLNFGLWGVPSFKVTGGNRQEAFCCWDQDRLWRVETEISERLN